ncbi:MAG: hypothetical protein HUJ56_05955 [Erysipelotrichaceae bacterium]|nr:hypothetical protein [Erysipelotrichaceae bacterium]
MSRLSRFYSTTAYSLATSSSKFCSTIGSGVESGIILAITSLIVFYFAIFLTVYLAIRIFQD